MSFTMIMLYGSFDSHYKLFPVNSAFGGDPSYIYPNTHTQTPSRHRSEIDSFPCCAVIGKLSKGSSQLQCISAPSLGQSLILFIASEEFGDTGVCWDV